MRKVPYCAVLQYNSIILAIITPVVFNTLTHTNLFSVIKALSLYILTVFAALTFLCGAVFDKD